MAEETKKDKKKLVLFDAQAVIHRAYHALPDFASSKGEPTGALYGLSLMLLKIISEFKPDFMAACFDVKEKTYRHEAYEDYKATRKKTDEELIFQIEKSKKVFEAFGIPVYEKPGFEADDLLGTAVEELKNNKEIEIIIASGDMDTMQLISGDKVKVYTLKKGIKDTVLYNQKDVLDRFGFEPELLPDYKGLRGDPSDNIIGIPGIGEKTATDLIKNFGSLENIYKKLKKEEKGFEEKGFKKRIIDLLKQYEEEAMFSKMLATIRRDAPINFKLPSKEWEASIYKEQILSVLDEFDFKSLKERVKKELFKEVAPQTLSLISDGPTVPEKDLKETEIACWLLDSNVTTPALSDILRVGRAKDFNKAKENIFADLEKNNLKEIFEKIEKPLISIIEKMERRGIKIDVNFLNKLSKEYHKELSQLEKKIWSLSGKEFNINSPKQLGEILFDDLGLKVKNQKKTSGGSKSTRESELVKMKDLHPIIPIILEYREYQKLLSTYIDNISQMLEKDGKLHAKFKQTGTTTGRMSSENPNLQNIPIKTDLGKKIRDAFVADNNFVMAAFDYSQIDLRSAAFMSKDEKLIDIFKAGGDVHRSVASLVFGVKEDQVDYEMRRKAKVINFGIIYGMGVNALRVNLGTTREEASQFLDNYFKTFSTLANYLENVKKEASKNGYTETFFGRKRYFPALRSRIPYVKAAAERMAINAPLQGTSADIIKLAMVKVDEYLKENKLEDKVYLILNIHDELIYEISEDVKDKVVPDIKKIMEGVLDPKEIQGIPLLTSSKTGKNWGEV